MPAALIPWETCSIPEEIQKELVRRKTNVSFNYKSIEGWNKDGGDWEKYKGPQTAWLRVCSNGFGRPNSDGTGYDKPGFVLTGKSSFYQTYGFASKPQMGNKQILGYTPDGKEHFLEYDKNTSQYPIHVPNPEVVRVETIVQKELYRRCWIHWTCFSKAQLEYMTPYFLVPRISMIVEFGWNNFNPESLIDLTDTNKLYELYFKNPYPIYNKNILESNGNYDVVYGIVTNFEWSVEGNKFNCMTEVTSLQRLVAGVPISSIVADLQSTSDKDKENKTSIDYFANIRKLCASNTNFIKNIQAISQLDDINKPDADLSRQELYKYVVGGKTPMRKEYWRGVFFGRNDKNMKLSKNNLDFEWTSPVQGDFDKGSQTIETWVNMGFIVELLNRCFPFPDPKNENFLEINVDESVIGAHPNHISTDGSIMLIPNAYAPKYHYGNLGIQQNTIKLEDTPGTTRVFLQDTIQIYKDAFSKVKSKEKTTAEDYIGNNDYINQFLDPKSTKKINKKTKDSNDPLWNADYQLTKTFYQNDPYRDDLDFVINANRYIYECERNFYSFPFITEEELEVKNRTGEVAKYDPYFYGYFKDLYINVNEFIRIVHDENIKTYEDLYKKIFEQLNKAGGNFWDFALVVNDNTSKMTVVDNRMLPSGNNKQKPWYFDYQDSDQLITTVGFKPKMSDAQAFRVVFGETNNTGSRTVVKEENDLLNYQFFDRILNMKQDTQPTLTSDNNAFKNAFKESVRNQQNFTPIDKQFQFTITVNNKPYIRRLVLPDPELLNCLLDDKDKERNQRYTGIQPITVEVGLQGIGGLRTFQTFLIRNLPKPYYHKDVCYRIVDIHHTLQDGKWDTVVKAGIIPLRGYIKSKLGITD